MKYVTAHGHAVVHLMDPHSGATLCGIDNALARTLKRTVNCSFCSDIVALCRFVKIARESEGRRG